MIRPLLLCAALVAGGHAHAGNDDIVAATKLPLKAAAARAVGIQDKDVRDALNAAKEGNLKASESADVFEAARASAHEHGSVDNFGEFVQSKLKDGVRGKDLADAIRAEHKAHGRGHGEHGVHAKHGDHGEHGKAAGHGEHGEHGKAGGHGKAGEHGKHSKDGDKNRDMKAAIKAHGRANDPAQFDGNRGAPAAGSNKPAEASPGNRGSATKGEQTPKQSPPPAQKGNR